METSAVRGDCYDCESSVGEACSKCGKFVCGPCSEKPYAFCCDPADIKPMVALLDRNGLDGWDISRLRSQLSRHGSDRDSSILVLRTIAQLLEVGGRDDDFDRAQSDARAILTEVLVRL